MSQYKDLADKINRQDLIDFYKDHLPEETCQEFNIPNLYLLRQVLAYFQIPMHTKAETTKIQFERMSEQDKVARGKKISASNKGHETPQEVRNKISQTQKGVSKPSSQNSPTSFQKGHIPWNQGLKGAQHWKPGQAERFWATKKANGTVGKFKTKIESQIEQDLISKYGKNHVYYQYRDPQRYPFYCDFYVDTLDWFIEVNNWWHHGPHPYNPSSIEDEDLLNSWRLAATQSPDKKQYQEAIRIWTQVDPLKLKTAKQNNLNYSAIYSYKEFKAII